MRQRNVWRLQRRPVGAIDPADMSYGAEAWREPEAGEFEIETIYLSLDPTNRIWMSDAAQYLPPVAIGAPMRGSILGRVTQSRNPSVSEGDIYMGLGEWADRLITNGRGFRRFEAPKDLPLSTAYATLTGIGATAYFGLLDIGKPTAGETLVVSAAAGAVGSIVGQIGKIKGCRVIGIAGGDAKCRYLVEELGFDGAIDYRAEAVGERLDALAPTGVDINFEQVGGEIMDTVMSRMRLHGRMPLCGMISTYNDETPRQGPISWPLILMRRLTVTGFIISDFAARFDESAAALTEWMRQGQLQTREDVRHGLECALGALGDIYTGDTSGKLLVKVSPLTT